MWTEQTVETLRKFALEGKSAAWIAKVIGAPSRNAVIGKANRIGIKLNGGMGLASSGEGSPMAPPPANPWERKRPPRIEGEPRSQRRTAEYISWSRAASRARTGLPAIAREQIRADRRTYGKAEVGEMRRVGLAEIGEVECRWPLGDPTEDDFAYCGLPIAKGHAYCAGHCRLAYRPPHRGDI